MSDQFGMRLRAQTINWQRAFEYLDQLEDAGDDEDRQQEIVDTYAADGPDDVVSEINMHFSMRTLRDDLTQARIAVDRVLGGEIELGIATRNEGDVVIDMQPETGADAVVESAWRCGSLSAAGLRLA